MAAEVNGLEERKREILLRSQEYRRSLQSELHNLQAATAWIPNTARMVRSVYPVALLAVPLLGYLAARKRRSRAPASPSPSPNGAPTRRGILATAVAGYQFARKLKPVWDGFRSWRR